MFLSIILGSIGPTEFLLIFVGIILLFGGKKIPELMKGVGQGIKEFKKASKVDDPAVEEKKEPEKIQNN